MTTTNGENMDSKHLVNEVFVHYENWKKDEAKEDGLKLIHAFNELAKTNDLQTILEVHKQIRTVMIECVRRIYSADYPAG